jgi:hypothetical protein
LEEKYVNLETMTFTNCHHIVYDAEDRENSNNFYFPQNTNNTRSTFHVTMVVKIFSFENEYH